MKNKTSWHRATGSYKAIALLKTFRQAISVSCGQGGEVELLENRARLYISSDIGTSDGPW